MTGELEMEKGLRRLAVPGGQIPYKGPNLSEVGSSHSTKTCPASVVGKRAYTLAAYKNKVKDGKRAIVRMKLQKNGQLNAITSELLLLEARLRQEQKEILTQMVHKDAIITSQRQEIDKLRRENKRLIARLKKMSDSRSDDAKVNQHASKTRGESDPRFKNPKSTMKSPLKKASIKSTVSTSEISSLTSQFYDIHCSSSVTSAGEERIFHKPPIAEKPKLAATRILLRAKEMEEKEKLDSSQCNIVSTISRLLEEESDQGIAISSASSDEPSSPESTLKPTPRVMKIARQFEKELSKVASYVSNERKKNRQKALAMEEYEVTSGYNSENVSEQEHEHDYENVLVSSQTKVIDTNNAIYGTPVQLKKTDGDYEEVESYDADSTLVEEDPHIYSNVDYSSGEIKSQQPVLNIKSEKFWGGPSSVPSSSSSADRLLETNLDSSDTGSESALSDSPKSVKNVPRSRDNINLLMTSEGGNQIMQNFIEFSLDSLDLEDFDDDQFLGKENLPLCETRRCGDGAEDESKKSSRNDSHASHAESTPQWLTTTQGGIIIPSQCGYEKFLEVTGLSQKSILTPSRMFSNHRSVLKPRDIKHRDKLRAVFTSAACIPEENSAPITTTTTNSHCEASPSSSQRYWREPYL